MLMTKKKNKIVVFYMLNAMFTVSFIFFFYINDMLSGSGTFINELMTHDRFINVREHAHVCSAFAFSHYR